MPSVCSLAQRGSSRRERELPSFRSTTFEVFSFSRRNCNEPVYISQDPIRSLYPVEGGEFELCKALATWLQREVRVFLLFLDDGPTRHQTYIF